MIFHPCLRVGRGFQVVKKSPAAAVLFTLEFKKFFLLLLLLLWNFMNVFLTRRQLDEFSVPPDVIKLIWRKLVTQKHMLQWAISPLVLICKIRLFQKFFEFLYTTILCFNTFVLGTIRNSIDNPCTQKTKCCMLKITFQARWDFLRTRLIVFHDTFVRNFAWKLIYFSCTAGEGSANFTVFNELLESIFFTWCR